MKRPPDGREMESGGSMGTVLVVDGSDVCRAPIVVHTLRERFARAAELAGLEVLSRGLTAEPGATMCESASSRMGWSGSSIAFFGAHRATPLTVADIAEADLVLTAERQQRSAVVRMLPGTQAAVFTWKEALVLATVLTDRIRHGVADAPADAAGLARALHAARGTVPLIEPPVRTGVLHWRRAPVADPITVADGHGGPAQHSRVTQEALEVAERLGDRLAGLGDGVRHLVPGTRVHGRRRLRA